MTGPASWGGLHEKRAPTEANAPLRLLLFILFVGRLLDFSALAFRKRFERGFCIFFACIWSTANRSYGRVPKIAGDDFALIALAFTHDIIILRDLWMVGVDIIGRTPLPVSLFFLASADPGTCSTAAARTIVSIRMPYPH